MLSERPDSSVTTARWRATSAPSFVPIAITSTGPSASPEGTTVRVCGRSLAPCNSSVALRVVPDGPVTRSSMASSSPGTS